MDTLSNVKNGRVEEVPQGVRLAPDTFPEAKNVAEGVSVRYAPDGNKRWYVFRASYGREDQASDFIVKDGTYVYVAKHRVLKDVNGKTKKVTESLIPNLLFVYTTAEKAEAYVKDTPELSYISYYYNHFVSQGDQKNPPLTIPQREMENFILVTSSGSEHVMFVTNEQCHFKGGETVRVTEGVFKGVEGRVARVSGQQRVVVSVTSIGFVTTAYIPTAFLKVIDS